MGEINEGVSKHHISKLHSTVQQDWFSTIFNSCYIKKFEDWFGTKETVWINPKNFKNKNINLSKPGPSLSKAIGKNICYEPGVFTVI